MTRAVSGVLNQHAATRADDTHYYKANGQPKKKERKKAGAADPKESPPAQFGWCHTQCGDLWHSRFIHFEVFSRENMTIITGMSRVRSSRRTRHGFLWLIFYLFFVPLFLTTHGSLTSVGARTGLLPNRGWMVRFPERLQVYRGFPERGSRLRGAVARVARWIWRGLHVELQRYCFNSERVYFKLIFLLDPRAADGASRDLIWTRSKKWAMRVCLEVGV